MRVLAIFFFLLILLLSAATFVFLGVWTYRDARARGLNGALWTAVVLLVPSFIGLIVYLVAGRNQSVGLCPTCGAGIQPGVSFCPRCGQALGACPSAEGGAAPPPKPVPKAGRGALIAFVVCIALLIVGVAAFAAFGLFAYRSAPHTGIASNISIGSVENHTVSHWNLSFASLDGRRSGGQLHLDGNGPTALQVVSSLGEGKLTLELTQGDKRVAVDLSGANAASTVDLTEFEPGAVRMTLVAEDARDGKVEISWK